MKTQLIAIAFACGMLTLAACGGDHSSSTGKDTVTNTYGVKKDSSAMDTSKTTSPDHTASGGSDVAKDTTIKKDSIKK